MDLFTRLRTWFENLKRRDRMTLLWQGWAWFSGVMGAMGLVASDFRSWNTYALLWLLLTAVAWSMNRAIGDGQTPLSYVAPRVLLSEVQVLYRHVGRAQADQLRRSALLSAKQAWERDGGGKRRAGGDAPRRRGGRGGRGTGLTVVRLGGDEEGS